MIPTGWPGKCRMKAVHQSKRNNLSVSDLACAVFHDRRFQLTVNSAGALIHILDLRTRTHEPGIIDAAIAALCGDPAPERSWTRCFWHDEEHPRHVSMCPHCARALWAIYDKEGAPWENWRKETVYFKKAEASKRVPFGERRYYSKGENDGQE